ncbi:MAG: DUF5606 domain-containing protein [Paludibacteraceae bacterium]|jgi:hypothetical protein|nr:DUF5606 domain-containing protein [Paludibacteraceae bacterium]
MLKNILAISGKPGLFKLVSRGTNMLIVESLIDGKRIPTYSRDKIVSLAEVSMYTTGEDVSLSEVLNALGKKYNFKAVEMDAKKADNEELRAFFAEVLPTFDRDRVYPSDIRKLIAWYNLLIQAGFTDFTLQEDEEGKEAVAEKSQEPKAKSQQPKANVKTSKSAAGTVKTGVGTKRG